MSIDHQTPIALCLMAVIALAGCRQDPLPDKKPDLTQTEKPQATLEDRVTVSLEDEPVAPRADLDEIRDAGVLRVLVHQPAQISLERTGSPIDRELALVETFARAEALAVRFVNVSERDQLIEALLEGRGDMIAAQFSQTTRRQGRVRFSAPLRFVQEILVAPKEGEEVPSVAGELAGREVSVRLSSSFADTLKGLGLDPPVKVIAVDEHLDPHTVLSRVGQGAVALSVADSDTIESYLSYRDDIQTTVVLKDKVPIAWAMHPGAAGLKAATDAFIEANVEVREGAGSAFHTDDLEGIRRRGILRVAMPNNANSYFFYRGLPMGQQYSVAKRLAKRLGLRMEVVVARRQKDLIPLLLDGRADLIAPVLTETPQRREVLDFSTPLTEVDEVLVQPKQGDLIESIDQLAGREVHVRRSSSYWHTLTTLSTTIPTLKVVAADEALETEDLINQVAEGTIPLTVADFDILAMGFTLEVLINGGLVLGKGRSRGFAMRKNNPALKAAVDKAVEVEKTENDDEPTFVQRRKHQPRRPPPIPTGALSPYDDLARTYGERFGVDWRLIVAQMKVESSFDATFRNWVGAQGLLQVMPHTLPELGLDHLDLSDPEQGIHAGVHTFKALYDRFEASLNEADRRRFALAAYHIGFDHVQDARNLAIAEGLDADLWVSNVERAIILLEKPAYAGAARFGYCRGVDAIRYVSTVEAHYHKTLEP